MKRKNKKKSLASLFFIINIIGGGLYFYNKSPNKNLCSSCEQSISLSIPVKIDGGNDKTEELVTSETNTNKALPVLSLKNIEEENERLLLQRDINKIVARNFKHPFNYDGKKMCLITFKKDEYTLDNCKEDYVHRRAVENSLGGVDLKAFFKKYSIKSEQIVTILIEV